MVIERVQPKRAPLRLAYFDPEKGLRQFVDDGQGKRMYGLSGQAFLRAVAERTSEQKSHLTESETVSVAERRRRERYGTSYLDQQVKTPDGRLISRADRLLERVNQYSDMAIAKTYGIEEAQVDDFHKKRLEQANEFVQNHIHVLFPHLVDSVGLTNDATLITGKRSGVLSQFIDDPEDNHLHFETQRQLVLAELSAELSERSREYNLAAEVKEVQRYLTRNLFSGVDFQNVYGVHEETTNQLVSLHADATPTGVGPGYFITEIENRMRQVPITETYINDNGNQQERIISYETSMCDVRMKPRPSEMRKALRKAELRSQKGQGDAINVYEDVLDSTGLTFVVKGAMDSHTSPEVNRVVAQVKKVMEQNPRWGKVEFIPDFETNQDGSQSKGQRYQRYQVIAENLPLPFEMIFYAQRDSQNGQNELGERQEETYVSRSGKLQTKVKYTGRAHDLFKMTQALDINDYLFPPSMHFYNGKRDLRAEAYKHMDEVAQSVRNRTRRREIHVLENGDDDKILS